MLAAGGSSRFGSPKQLIEYEGQALVRRAATAAAAAGAHPVLVVLGANAEQIASSLAGLTSVEIVVNERWSDGLASSLTAGLRAALEKGECDAILVTLADQPLVDAAALKRLIAAFDDDHRIVASEYDDTVGVPAVFAREHFAELMRLEGDAGAGRWLRARPSDVTRVRLDAAVVDVDAPSDLGRLFSRSVSGSP